MYACEGTTSPSTVSEPFNKPCHYLNRPLTVLEKHYPAIWSSCCRRPMSSVAVLSLMMISSPKCSMHLNGVAQSQVHLPLGTPICTHARSPSLVAISMSASTLVAPTTASVHCLLPSLHSQSVCRVSRIARLRSLSPPPSSPAPAPAVELPLPREKPTRLLPFYLFSFIQLW